MPLVLIFWFLCILRAEVERVRCGKLGDGVIGRVNVISDKEFRDKNKALMTSNQQQHSKANNIYYMATIVLLSWHYFLVITGHYENFSRRDDSSEL